MSENRRRMYGRDGTRHSEQQHDSLMYFWFYIWKTGPWVHMGHGYVDMLYCIDLFSQFEN